MSRKKSNTPHVAYTIHREYLGKDGLWNPRDRDPPLEAAFQVNLTGSRDQYLQLADAIRAFANRKTSDPDFHEHFEGLLSTNGKARFHIILRKDEMR